MKRKIECDRCSALILPETAARTGGMCMRCADAQELPEPEVSCTIAGLEGTSLCLVSDALDFLPKIVEAMPVGSAEHPNGYELAAQRALVRHCIQHRQSLVLCNDHWNRTGWAFLELFEIGKAYAKTPEEAKILFCDLKREEWQTVGSQEFPASLMSGFQYFRSDGKVIFKMLTTFT